MWVGHVAQNSTHVKTEMEMEDQYEINGRWR